MTEEPKKYSSPDIRNIDRGKERLHHAFDFAIGNRTLTIETPTQRIDYLFHYWMDDCKGRQNGPRAAFYDFLSQALYADRDFIKKLNLTPMDTVLRDRRALEEEGFFSKPKDQPEAVKQMVKQATLV